MERHLQSLVNQRCGFGQIIIVASGEEIESIVMSFKDKLPVEHYQSESGQIRQRNLGISKINKNSKLVATMDDDIIYEKNAIRNIIEFWNKCDNKTAGVGFNLYREQGNIKPTVINILKSLLDIKPGAVTITGTKIPPIARKDNIQTQFLPGGCTVWKKEILNEFKQSEINTIWAQGEDLRFSYPISKKYNLYICSNAQVKEINNEVAYDSSKIFIAKKKALAKIYFTSCHEELSTNLAVGLLLLKIILNILSIKNIQNAIGQLLAVFTIIYTRLIKKDLIQYLSD